MKMRSHACFFHNIIYEDAKIIKHTTLLRPCLENSSVRNFRSFHAEIVLNNFFNSLLLSLNSILRLHIFMVTLVLRHVLLFLLNYNINNLKPQNNHNYSELPSETENHLLI